MKEEYSYVLKRSNRKSVAIYITKEAMVEVRAPFDFPKEKIDAFVLSKSQWIDTHLKRVAEGEGQKEKARFQYGDRFFYHGKACLLVGKEGEGIGFDEKQEEFYMPKSFDEEKRKTAIIFIYKQLAKRELAKKVAHFALVMEVSPRAVKINSATTRWGSCSSKGNLNFSWRLVMAKEDCIDYVVIHELAHLKEMNHGSSFWSVVEKYCPLYKKRKEDLKKLQKTLCSM